MTRAARRALWWAGGLYAFFLAQRIFVNGLLWSPSAGDGGYSDDTGRVPEWVNTAVHIAYEVGIPALAISAALLGVAVVVQALSPSSGRSAPDSPKAPALVTLGGRTTPRAALLALIWAAVLLVANFAGPRLTFSVLWEVAYRTGGVAVEVVAGLSTVFTSTVYFAAALLGAAIVIHALAPAPQSPAVDADAESSPAAD